MDNAGCAYQLKKIPWERTKRYIQSGELDLAIGASKTADRRPWAYFSEPYRFEEIFKHLEFVGNQSATIIFLTGCFNAVLFSLLSEAKEVPHLGQYFSPSEDTYPHPEQMVSIFCDSFFSPQFPQNLASLEIWDPQLVQ